MVPEIANILRIAPKEFNLQKKKKVEEEKNVQNF